MIFYKKAIFAFVLLIVLPCAAWTQTQSSMTREEYIDRYKSIAVAHMERYGIPASITMAQGILESNCGNSLLSRSSNNHFGIKCKKDWEGERVYHDDDAKGECFRRYPSVEASYLDHAEFLDLQPRYDPLFSFASNDYKSWARGLKSAGYATAPDYAERLIKIIEESGLYLLDSPDGERLYAESRGQTHSTTPEEWFSGQSSVEHVSSSDGPIDPDNYRVTINAHNGYNVYQTNSVYYILAKENDTFEHIGREFRISARNLRKFNDLRGNAQPLPGEVVYIERKKRRWEGNAMIHTAREGETAYAVGQSYAIRTRSVERLNKLNEQNVLAKGQIVKIR